MDLNNTQNLQVTEHPPVPSRKTKFSRFVTFGKSAVETMSVISKFLFYGFLILSFAGLFGSLLGGGSAARPVEQTLYGDGPEKVIVLDLVGTIVDDVSSGTLGALDAQYITPRSVLKQLEAIKNDELIRGVVLRINSPGGSVTASEEIYDTIQRFKQTTDIPVYVYMSDTAASGGYYISLAADRIFANTATITGSIGVIASVINFKELADQYGVREVVMASGDNKAFLDPLLDVDPQEQAIMQSIVDDAYEEFLEKVLTDRELNRDDLLPLADGRPLSGLQAEAANLVDEVTTFHGAIDSVRDELGVPDARIVTYGSGSILESLLGAINGKLMPWADLPFITLQRLNGHPSYLYRP